MFAIPRYRGERGHPVLFRAPVLAEFLALPAGAAARDVVHAYASRTVYVDVDDFGVVRDADTPEDYEALLKATEERLMPRIRLIRRFVLLAVLLVAIAGIAAPFINADRFGARIREALERSLGRKVQIGRVHFNLFTGPGFTIDDVLIHEDPRFGVEPFAHVQQLDARVGLASIWTGRLSFSRLRLLEPSVNLVRRSEGGWNMVALLDHAVHTQGGEGERLTLGLPSVEVRSGRLYFKQDDTKSGFYVLDTDVDISPRDGGRRGFDIKFSAGPARTDRTAQAFATMRGRGQWEPGPAAIRHSTSISNSKGREWTNWSR